ncbi:hypothetical protein DAA51_39080 [Bradyrhizobium sp. WBAH10]|nr:hypothetical protein [Bradyrhizobium sp. WBAH30]MDD1547734.1 hypothetical protein [Bradyrhizobium sp. WBAH41]MDD1561379.1 hypothetical protein [Bradyrhizobium sp. WBAH23]MDD1568819.1 hypothetical protein [Bradyrhizobium sp. WBAH33]MDD1594796.1 hypothetical protein [Bradyrhizobium sp. WBAH42]NRB92346.1 hypothetical protein [Bradyrhizobium sp. WBAH10]QCJ93669.1 hypothetical protein DAA57_38915 [Bradyrhizobium yuanmingense]
MQTKLIFRNGSRDDELCTMSSRQLKDECDAEEAEAIAAALDLTLDELNQIEYTINEIANDDGLVYAYGVEIKEGAPQYILDKLAPLPWRGNLAVIHVRGYAHDADQEEIEIEMARTTVYKVKLYNIATDEVVISRRMATYDGAAKMGGWPVKGTGHVIELADLEPGEEWTPRDFDPTTI